MRPLGWSHQDLELSNRELLTLDPVFLDHEGGEGRGCALRELWQRKSQRQEREQRQRHACEEGDPPVSRTGRPGCVVGARLGSAARGCLVDVHPAAD